MMEEMALGASGRNYKTKIGIPHEANQAGGLAVATHTLYCMQHRLLGV
jgi:hypothetical protein